MQNLLIRPVELPKQDSIYFALGVHLPIVIALSLNSLMIWLIVGALYSAVTYLFYRDWSNLLQSWWLGWGIFISTYTALHFLPIFNQLPATQLLLASSVFVVAVFALVSLQQRNVFYSALTVMPISLELGRYLLFRDLAAGFAPLFIMSLVAAAVYTALLFAARSERFYTKQWMWLMWGLAVYGIVAILTSWPMILGYVLLYNYLPLLFLLLTMPLFGAVMLQVVHRLSQYEAVPFVAGRITLPLLALALCSWIAFAFMTPSTITADATVGMIERQKVIVDTDMSFDDYVALIYLLQHPEIEVVGVTSVHGVASVAAGTENIRRVLNATGNGHIPVAVGAQTGLESGRAFPQMWTTLFDSMARLSLPPVASRPLPAATTLMNDLISESPDEVTVIALGPLTNMAQLFQQDVNAAASLDQLVVGGGAIDVANPTPDGEKDWNLWLDPAANEIVLASGAEMIWTPLDLTHYDLRLDQYFTNQWQQQVERNELLLMTRIPHMLVLFAGQAQPVWDLVTAAVVTDPELCTEWRQLALTSIQGSGETAGFLEVNNGAAPNTSVCVQGDQHAFETAVLRGTR